MQKTLKTIAMAWAVVTAAGCAHVPAEEPRDPLEPVNRAVYKFNDKADHYVLRPVAKEYVAVVPQPVRTGVNNFLNNLGYPKTIVNDLFQAKFKQSASDLGRLLLNTTAGVGGIVDVATDTGLPRHDEDFGQTLGYWGVGEGWFLMLPLFGPSTIRDAAGLIADRPMNPTWWLDGDHDWLAWSITGVSAINLRANLLDADKILDQQLDRYIFIRTAYLQQRQSLVYDGNPPPEDYNYDIPDDSGGKDTGK
jgi:phospholipid-binding lipoprotein MlaA